MHHVVALITSSSPALEYACVHELFAPRNDGPRLPYSFASCATEGDIRDLRDSWLNTGSLSHLDELDSADTIIVLSSPIDRKHDPRLLAALMRAANSGRRIVSFGSGAFVLAQAGILDGRRATLHGAFTDEFAREFPRVRLQPEILYVRDGNIHTAGGASAGLDLLLHLVRGDCGLDACNTLCSRLNHPPLREGGQAQFSVRALPQDSDARINTLIAWLRENCYRSVQIAELADRVGMSPRNFFRHFRSVTGRTPYDWLLRERLTLAKNLLETTTFRLERVAELSGFPSSDALRAHFTRAEGVAPSRYRRELSNRRVDEQGGEAGARDVPMAKAA